MLLPNFQSGDRIFQMLQSQWTAILNPVLSNPLTNPRILKNVPIAIGVNTINHGLQRMQQGWVISDITSAAQIYRSQPFNDLTLTLTSDAVATINLVVF